MRFVWCDDHMTFEQKGCDCPGKKHVESRLMLMPDIEPFVSPVTGKVVGGRRQLREHNLVNNVTNVADFREEWKKAAKDREAAYRGVDKSRKEDVARAVDQIINGRKR